MATSEDLELVSLTKNISSTEVEEEVKFQRVLPQSGTSRRGNTYRANGNIDHFSTKFQNVFKKQKFYLPALCFCAVSLTVWIFTLTWIAVRLRIEMQRLTNITNKVSAGNEAIPDAIQQCHSLTRQLEKNQTKIIDQMQQVAQRLTNFSNMISSIQAGLSNVEKKLNDSPELVTTPTTLHSLMSSIASIGGQLNDFNITTAKISNEQKKILEQIDGIMRNLTLVNEDIQELRENPFVKPIMPNQNNSAIIVQEVIEKISPNITSINNTLTSRIQWVLDDQNNSQKSINELKDEYEYCKSQIMTIKEDQMNQNKMIKEVKVDSAHIKNEMSDFKAVVNTSEAYVKNISMQLISCTQACLTNSTPVTPLNSTIPMMIPESGQ